MVCSTRFISAAQAVFLLFLLPQHLHADGSIAPAFFTNDLNKPAAAPTATTNGGQKTPAARSSAALPLTVAALTYRVAAPFAPTLTLRSQVLSVDSEWRGAVYVDGGVTVASNTTLTIHPGTVVRFSKGSGIQVLGRIVMKGTAENPVRLTSLYRESQEFDWSGIFLSGTDKKNILEHVVIEGADTAVVARFSTLSTQFVEIGSSASGFLLQSSNATIANTTITVPVTAISAAKSELFMKKCSIAGGQFGMTVNTSSVEAHDISIKSCRLTAFSAYSSQLKLVRFSISACQNALRLNSCDGSVSDSFFTDNLETGVVLTGSNLRFTGNTLVRNRVGIQLDDNLSALWSNAITGNSSYNLIYLGEESLFIGGNSFDGSSNQEAENRIFSKRPGAVQIVPLFAIEPIRSTH